jgi:5'-nucleotidase
MRILLTNDDGILAPGILAAKAALDTIAEVVVVAPERQRSAAGHAITLHKPLRLIPSGINAGANLGWDLTYSGTVSAAMEGAVLGLPAFAISLVLENGGPEPMDFGHAARFAARLALQLRETPMPPVTLLNVNVPNRAEADHRGVTVTHQGRREYIDRIVAREDPSGRPYYWLAGSLREEAPDPGSDVHAILEDRISVTPVHLDMTAYTLLDTLRAWKLGTSNE